MGELGRQIFGPGQPAFAIIQLMVIALIGWIAGALAQAAGKHQIATIIHASTIFVAITIVVGVAFGVAKDVFKFIGF